MWTLPFTGAVQMKDVPTVDAQEALGLLAHPLVQECQVDDELPRQVGDLTPADARVPLSQFIHDLSVVARLQKERFPDTDQHVVSDRASGGHKGSEFFGADLTPTPAAPTAELARDELANRQRRHLPALRLEHRPLPLPFAAVWTAIRFRAKSDGRQRGKEIPESQIPCQFSNDLTQCFDDLVFSFFLLSP